MRRNEPSPPSHGARPGRAAARVVGLATVFAASVSLFVLAMQAGR
jgi:hypothetical protein